MPETYPSQLKIEVKTSRDSQHELSERDLDGIKPDGYAAVLVTERLYHGPRWVLVPGSHLSPGSHADSDLDQLARNVLPDLTAALNRFWSNWIMDDSVWQRIFAQQNMPLLAALDWCLQNHPPRSNQSQGNLREGRLVDALALFRDALDKFVETKGPQQEGFVHQRLLACALEQLGYRLNENPIGVPDILATWTGHDPKLTIGDLRERLQGWDPAEPQLRELRERLLNCTVAELHNVRELFLAGNQNSG